MNETTDITGPTLVAVSQLDGGIFWRQNSGLFLTLDGARHVRAASQNGIADIMGAYKSRPVAIETKTKTGKQLRTQRTFQKLWERAGGVYIIPRSPGDAVNALLALNQNG